MGTAEDPHMAGMFAVFPVLLVMALYVSAFILGFWLLYRLVSAAERTASALDRLVAGSEQRPPSHQEGDATAS